MNAIRVVTRPATDGELLLKNLPVKKNQLLEVIILTQEKPEEDAFVLSVLQHDPGYAFLREAAEDLYTLLAATDFLPEKEATNATT